MAKKKPKKPWIKFYTQDWRADPRLRLCSPVARCVWFEMLTIMHEAQPYGHFVVEAVAPDLEQTASLVSVPIGLVESALKELEMHGVFSRTERGVIYSRRMVRDEKKRKKDKQNGAKGGNPTLIAGVNPQVNGDVKAQRPEARGQNIDDDGGDARESAFAVATEVGALCGHPTPQDWPPGFCGAPHRIQTWLAEGWKPEIILSAVKESLARKRDGPPDSINYFEKPIARAHALASAPVPKVKIIEAPATEIRRETPGNVIAAADRLVERLADFDRPAPNAVGELRGGAGPNVVRLLPEGRRE